jgi:adenine-specific DNA-methyltransferase
MLIKAPLTREQTYVYRDVKVRKFASKARKDKKTFASYYTPFELQEILCDWAIRSPCDNILEPSFGGCGFLESAINQLFKLGNHMPLNNLYGCDINKEAFIHLSEKIQGSHSRKNFICDDFLSLRPIDFNISEFDVLVGNPPYISHHNMTRVQKESAAGILKGVDFGLGRTASLWAYFVIHGFEFLKRNGRVAWVLPNSLLFADYTNSIKIILKEKFKRVLFIPIEQHLFLNDGVEERTVIVLAEGWLEGPAVHSIEISPVQDLNQLKKQIELWTQQQTPFKTLCSRSRRCYLSESELTLFDKICDSHADNMVVRLGDVADIKIGIVTGDNKFFIIDKETAEKNHLKNDAWKSILPKLLLARGIFFTTEDYMEMQKNNARCLLINPSKKTTDDDALKKYLGSYPEEKRINNATFKKRAAWFSPDDGAIPDAFFPYMHHEGPRIVLNQGKIQCTNSIHRVFFKESITEYDRKLIALSLLSSFSQLSAEIEGRNYGSGVLKHEPSDAKRIAIIFPKNTNKQTIDESFNKIDRLLRDGLIYESRMVADELVMKDLSIKFDANISTIFNKVLLNMRHNRIRG